VTRRTHGTGIATGVLVGLVALAVAACSDAERKEPSPGPRPAESVREAALRTLGAGPANIKLRVRSPTGLYSLRGAVELATDRSRMRADVERAPMTHFDPVINMIGLGAETYELRPRGQLGLLETTDSDCGFDPHAPIGSLPGTASIQETVALPGVVVRLLRDGTRQATAVGTPAGGGATYRVVVDPAKAAVAPSARGGDEVIGVPPRRLARHLAPLRVTVDREGVVRRLALRLRRFRPAVLAPRIVRERRRVDVSIAVWLSDFGRRLEVRAPPCIAME
jgi:hypothetical protein